MTCIGIQQGDGGFCLAGELDFGLFALGQDGTAEGLDQRIGVLPAGLLQQVLKQQLIQADAADLGAGLGEDATTTTSGSGVLRIAFRFDQHDCDIEGAPAEIKYQIAITGLDMGAIAEGSGGGFVDQAIAGQPSRSGRLPQPGGVVFVALNWNGEGDFLFRKTQILAGQQQQPGKEVLASLVKAHLPIPDAAPTAGAAPSDVALGPTQGVGMLEQVALQHLLPQPLAPVFPVVDQGWDHCCGAIPLGVQAAVCRRCIRGGLLEIRIPEGQHGVGGAEINGKTACRCGVMGISHRSARHRETPYAQGLRYPRRHQSGGSVCPRPE